LTYIKVASNQYVTAGCVDGCDEQLLLGLEGQLFDHELFHPSVDLCFFLVLEIKHLSTNEFFGRLLDEVGGDERLNEGHCLLMWVMVKS
jgi:hypothetical protein